MLCLKGELIFTDIVWLCQKNVVFKLYLSSYCEMASNASYHGDASRPPNGALKLLKKKIRKKKVKAHGEQHQRQHHQQDHRESSGCCGDRGQQYGAGQGYQQDRYAQQQNYGDDRALQHGQGYRQDRYVQQQNYDGRALQPPRDFYDDRKPRSEGYKGHTNPSDVDDLASGMGGVRVGNSNVGDAARQNKKRQPPANMVFKDRMEVNWTCNHCEKECIPVRGESRCLCGHRYKEHNKKKFGCDRCKCRKFFFVVAEGAWVLRCRCKHKHIDHDPVTHKCKKCKNCTGFDSPWVCNCGHPWNEHTQGLKRHKMVVIDGKEIPASLFAHMMGAEEEGGGIAPEINNVQRDPLFGKQMYGKPS